ncbi:DNA oxidative demethylase AlkB [Glaciimonas immobilis]|uniref:Alpha-ketoglutarate-dependent dioxygenase AlkB n=1 Tax=Glaciimonas immobilis TaxID=728004 RepID=A0A840S013_9BURK|nr:DNA oxidative demethylase AlkB [Glaciimonas immobilis]KAF3998361.1 DNA oxidative demethylase AlkB [Glaciimonas immobilis]MBB5201990.1 alkylated DNA repair protein (DNA oxidative demethylase) [Glaciimonas immobilis]
MTFNLFEEEESRRLWHEPICPGAVVLRQFALADDALMLTAIKKVVTQAPFRHMITPGGLTMSAAMSSCGTHGWVTDRRGYRYAGTDPESGLPWPALPAALQQLAASAASSAGYPDFVPDACLINRYAVGARMSLHQDKDEPDLDAPIVSVSLGLPATFQFGGLRREMKPLRIPLTHGDVVVWGGPARLFFHGVSPIKHGIHPLTGEYRINLTFRKVT